MEGRLVRCWLVTLGNESLLLLRLKLTGSVRETEIQRDEETERQKDIETERQGETEGHRETEEERQCHST